MQVIDMQMTDIQVINMQVIHSTLTSLVKCSEDMVSF